MTEIQVCRNSSKIQNSPINWRIMHPEQLSNIPQKIMWVKKIYSNLYELAHNSIFISIINILHVFILHWIFQKCSSVYKLKKICILFYWLISKRYSSFRKIMSLRDTYWGNWVLLFGNFLYALYLCKSLHKKMIDRWYIEIEK